MKAIISTTYSDTYLYFLPIVSFCWQKLGVDTICFMPEMDNANERDKIELILNVKDKLKLNLQLPIFKAPKHKEATYAQCSRLFGACLDLPLDEVLVVGDVDMLNFKLPPSDANGFTIWGADLVPTNQFPMCYISATVINWARAFGTNGKNYQERLDELVGVIECEHFRGNQWSLDQDTAYKNIYPYSEAGMVNFIPRSNGENQFALHRVDRADLHYKDRLDHDIIDAHLWRDGYTEENHFKIMELLQFMYPNENFEWLNNYRNEYLKLL